jgi:hypothetical protein
MMHGPLNVKLYVYCVKGFSVQIHLQIPLHLYSRTAESGGSNVKIEWTQIKLTRYAMHIF